MKYKISDHRNFLSCITALIFCVFGSCSKQPTLIHREKAEVTIFSGDSRLSADDIYLSADTVYILATHLLRSEGQSLFIEAGTLIKVNDNISVVINSGATIHAKGTQNAPIIFTGSNYSGGQGLQCSACTSNHTWTGILLYGNSLIPQSSGELSFVRIEFAGSNESDQAPSLLLDNVNKETSIDHVEVSYSSFSPSFEIRGGNVNLSHLISYASNRSDFFIHGGYTGMMQNILAYRHPYFPVSITGTVAGIHIDGNGDSVTAPIISNLSVIGPDLQSGTSQGYFLEPPQKRSALLATGASRFHIRNSLFTGFPKMGFFIDEYSTAHALHFAESEFVNNIIHSNDTTRTFTLPVGVYRPYVTWEFKSYMLQPRFRNKIIADTRELLLNEPYNYDVHPDPSPMPSSPLLSTAGYFDSTLYSNSFFKQTSYVGALGSDNWMRGWTNFTPLQTNYNN